MYTLAWAGAYGAALELANRLPALDDQNLQAMRAMCHAALGDRSAALAALDRARDVTGARSYVIEPARRAVFDHATAVVALMPRELDRAQREAELEVAISAVERVWKTYPEREWFKSDPNLAAVRETARWAALVKT